MASDASRSGSVVVLDFFAEGRHLVVDAVLTKAYRNVILKNAFAVPGYAAKQVEDRKLQVDRISSQPIAAIHRGPHVLVPFAMEDEGCLGAHVFALLRALAIVALDKGKHPPPPFVYKSAGFFASTPVSLWVRCYVGNNACPLGFI